MLKSSLTLFFLLATIFTPSAEAAIKIESYSLNSLLNTARGLNVDGGTSESKKNMGNSSSDTASLAAIKVKFRSIADTTVNEESSLSLVNDFDLFQTVAAEVIGKALFYPNPFRLSSGAELGYMLSKNMDIDIRIYNMFGRQIFANTFKSGTPGGYFGYNKLTFNKETLSGYDLSAGAYFFIIINSGKVLAKGKFAVIP